MTVEQAYVVYCDGDECETATEDWQRDSDEARLYAGNEGFHAVGDEDFCNDCFKRYQRDVIMALEAETEKSITYGKTDGTPSARCGCGQLILSRSGDAPLQAIIEHLQTHQLKPAES